MFANQGSASVFFFFVCPSNVKICKFFLIHLTEQTTGPTLKTKLGQFDKLGAIKLQSEASKHCNQWSPNLTGHHREEEGCIFYSQLEFNMFTHLSFKKN